MHTIIPCILILVTIHGEMFDMYFEEKLPNENSSSIFPSGVECNELNIKKCYDLLLFKYTNELLPKIGNIFNDTILRLLKEYNVLVMLLLSKYPTEMDEADDEITEAIQFEDSRVYCVIGFLSIINVNLNDKLNDFIFFAQLKQIKQKKNVPIKTILKDHFNNRMDELNTKDANVREDIVKADRKEITNQITKLKKTINKYSKPFCDIDLPWMKADSWMWTKLESSPILSKAFGENVNQATSPSLLEWQDIKVDLKHSTDLVDVNYKYNYDSSPSINVLLEDFNQRCKDLFLYVLDYSCPQETNAIPEVVKDMMDQLQYNFQSMEIKVNDPSNPIPIIKMGDKVASPHEKNSLRTLFQNEYDTVTFDEIEKFHLTISHSIDAYVTKVLFYRILDRLAYSLEMYSLYLKKHNQTTEQKDTKSVLLKNLITEFLHLGDQFTAFQITWELYTNSKPLTLGQYAIPDGNRILNFARFEYIQSVVHCNVEQFTVNKIKKYLEDVRFHKLNENKSISSTSDSKWINPTQEITEINTILSKLVEIKRQI
ncbi:Hypothetical protein CINCED_3A004421 [Cinara cedri]|uniref:Uncharacterized protein n=1 Tax=Cinara cedri TaxID=506608 RepID=A0A5E4NA32_9HEMI|nr:Hypothetical protein CINCED_3A004421 [Cinara cedri]